MSLQKHVLALFALSFLSGFFACGGGSHPPPPPPVIAPTITTQPVGQSAADGTSATFSVVASGTAPLSYQWNRGGTPLANATSSSFTTPLLAMSDNGASFSVTVSNTAGSITSAPAVLTVHPVAPSISVQPANQTVEPGASASFSVTASGTAPLSYQWSRGRTPITGATSSTYTTPTTTLADNGASFTVAVSNAAGSLVSSAAVLTVQILAPSITVQPASQSVQAGQTATFNIIAAGTAPLSYQWSKNGVPIAGANAASHTTPPTVLADSGATFAVTVSNAAGTATSQVATLAVTQASDVATALAYTDPTTGAYRLKKNAGLSTPTHLVLDLIGPSAGTASGISITLGADTSTVTWVDVPAGGTTATLLQNGTQFGLGTGTPILKGRALGDTLQVTLAQKAPTAPASLNGTLLRIALDLKPGLGLAKGTAITLTADNTRCQVLDGAGTISSLSVAVGTLVAQ